MYKKAMLLIVMLLNALLLNALLLNALSISILMAIMPIIEILLLLPFLIN